MDLLNIAFTGPRNVRQEDFPAIAGGFGVLRNMSSDLTTFHSGGASGFDTIAFRQTALHDGFSHVLHIPFTYQEQALFLGVPDTSEFTMCPFCPSGMNKPLTPADNRFYQRRNEHMVDSAQLLVYYNPWKKGGTQNCIDYAKTTGIEMVSILDI